MLAIAALSWCAVRNAPTRVRSRRSTLRSPSVSRRRRGTARRFAVPAARSADLRCILAGASCVFHGDLPATVTCGAARRTAAHLTLDAGDYDGCVSMPGLTVFNISPHRARVDGLSVHPWGALYFLFAIVAGLVLGAACFAGRSRAFALGRSIVCGRLRVFDPDHCVRASRRPDRHYYCCRSACSRSRSARPTRSCVTASSTLARDQSRARVRDSRGSWLRLQFARVHPRPLPGTGRPRREYYLRSGARAGHRAFAADHHERVDRFVDSASFVSGT